MKDMIRFIISEEVKKVLNKKRLLVLIGPPSVGKSHWIENHFKNADSIAINRDEIVEAAAQSFGLTYDELFEFPPADSELGETIDGKEKFGPVVPGDETISHLSPIEYENIQKINRLVADNLGSKFATAVNSDKDILIDMTNMNNKSRKHIFDKISGKEDEFEKIAVIFNFEGSDVVKIIKKLAHNRAEKIKSMGGSKTITPEIIDKMIQSYEPPSSEEGFDKVINVDNSSELKKALYHD